MLSLSLEAVRQVDGVGEVHGAGFDEALQEQQESVLVWIVDLALAHGEQLGRDDLVDHVALEAPDGLGLGDDNDIFIWAPLALVELAGQPCAEGELTKS